jgi:hypothetical protein
MKVAVTRPTNAKIKFMIVDAQSRMAEISSARGINVFLHVVVPLHWAHATYKKSYHMSLVHN